LLGLNFLTPMRLGLLPASSNTHSRHDKTLLRSKAEFPRLVQACWPVDASYYRLPSPFYQPLTHQLIYEGLLWFCPSLSNILVCHILTLHHWFIVQPKRPHPCGQRIRQ
jgi:hypothetical protein